MNVRRLAAGILSVAASILGLYLGLGSATSGLSADLLIGLSAILLVDSLVCLYGVRYAFLIAAVLAVALPADAILALPSMIAPQLSVLVLSVLCVAASIVTFRTKSQMSEQGNPMNLPVFG